MANLRYKKGLCRFKFFIKALTFQLQNFSTPTLSFSTKFFVSSRFSLSTILSPLISTKLFRLSAPKFFASQHHIFSPLISTKLFRLSAPYFFTSPHHTFSPLSTIFFHLSAPNFVFNWLIKGNVEELLV